MKAICIFTPNLTRMMIIARSLSIVTIALTTLLFSFNAYAQGDLKGKLDDYFKTYETAGVLSGHVFVEKDGKVLFEKSYGAASKRFDVPNTKATVYKLGKVTQPLISWLVMKAYADNKLDLTSSITKFLSEYPNEIGEKVKIEHLLNHTSGLPDFTSDEAFFLKHTCGDFAQGKFIREFCAKQPQFTPGSRYSFSYTNYYLLGIVLERVYEKDLAVIIEELLSAPLGMKSSGLLTEEVVVKGLADGYFIADGKLSNPSYLNIDYVGAAAGMYSSANDLIKWLDYLATDDDASKKQNSVVSTLTGKSVLGWEVSKVYDHTRKSVYGTFNGFASLVDQYPDDNIKVIILSNFEHIPIGRMAFEVPAILFDKPYVVLGDLKAKTVADAELLKFTGEYTLHTDAGDHSASVAMEAGALKVGNTKDGFTKLSYAGNNFFYIEGEESTVFHFNVSDGEVSGFTIITDAKLVQADKKK